MLMRRKGLLASSEFLLGRGRNTLFGSSWFFLLHPFSTLGIHPFRRSSATLSGDFHMIGHRTSLSAIGTISRMFSVPSVTSPACQSCLYTINSVLSEPTQSFPRSGLRRNIMSACSFLSGSELGGQLLSSSNRMSGRMLNSSMRAELCYSCKVIDYCRRTSGSLKIWEAGGKNSIYRCFWPSAAGRNFSLSIETHTRHFRASCAAPVSAGVVPDLSFDAASQGEQLENPVVVPDQKSPGERTLKLLSGSCYIPHPDKEKTGGEDAHFMCADEQVIGVADGVGGWANHGVDAGLYSRELMANSVAVIQDELKRSISIDPAMVLEKAYYSTKAKGSSTACIIALTNQGVHAVNLGDSGFIVVREGSIIFRSPVQQHDFNFTYQLESGNSSDLPSSAQVFTFPVASGDVIIAGTDGLFDNLYPNEVSAVVVQAVRSGLGPQVAAQKIAALARQRAEDKNRQTPFSTAAQNAGYRYYGGKLDDITVVVSYISAIPSL